MQKKVTKKQEIEYVNNNMKAIRKKEHIQIIAEHDGKIIGNANIWKGRLDANKHVGELNIGLSKEYREIGIGTKMLELLISMARKEFKSRIVKLDVYGDNLRAKHVYEKVGFRETGKIPKGCRRQNGKYYDDIIMIKVLKK